MADPLEERRQVAEETAVASVASLVELMREHLTGERAPLFVAQLAADIARRGLTLAQYNVILDAAVSTALAVLPEPKRVLRKDPPPK